MSIADHFDHSPDAGFTRRYDQRTARRQFQVSVALVLILAFATLALGMLARPEAPFMPKSMSTIDFGGLRFTETSLDNRR